MHDNSLTYQVPGAQFYAKCWHDATWLYRYIVEQAEILECNCPDVWQIISASKIRKYSLLLDLVPGLPPHRRDCQKYAIYHNMHIYRTMEAFSAHASQWRWYVPKPRHIDRHSEMRNNVVRTHSMS